MGKQSGAGGKLKRKEKHGDGLKSATARTSDMEERENRMLRRGVYLKHKRGLMAEHRQSATGRPSPRIGVNSPKHTHSLSCTKPPISSKTNILNQTEGFWETKKKTTNYSGIPSRGPCLLFKAASAVCVCVCAWGGVQNLSLNR